MRGRPWHRVLIDDPRHGPLPALLLAMTMGAGLAAAAGVLLAVVAAGSVAGRERPWQVPVS